MYKRLEEDRLSFAKRMNKKSSSKVVKAVTVRLVKGDHDQLIDLTKHTGISINEFVRRIIRSVHELTADESPEPDLPAFLAALRTSMRHKAGKRRPENKSR